MLLGIDVGGTYTDAVLLDRGIVVRSAKAPTTHTELLQGILAALDQVVQKDDEIERVALSTTLVTNAIVQHRLARVGMIIVPGPGLNIAGQFPGDVVTVQGYIDHRGREVRPVDMDQVRAAVKRWRQSSVTAVAVVGKFSVRNPQHELQIKQEIQNLWPELDCVVAGHSLSGQLNFPRRVYSAYLNAAVAKLYDGFVQAVRDSLRQRRITAPVHILKADGGTMPLEFSLPYPVETIFTGPAASVLGVKALCRCSQPCAMLDIGGTTTDIALWRGGVPVMNPKGAQVDDYLTHVRAFMLKSVGLGGDSAVRREDCRLLIGPERLGPAAALGGPVPTPTDAMVVLGLVDIGDKQRALAALNGLCRDGETVQQLANNILDTAAGQVMHELEMMIADWENEPVYRIDEFLAQQPFELDTIIGVGGGASCVVPRVAEKMGCRYRMPSHHMLANAIGAAVSRPTMTITLRADSEQGVYTVAEQGRRYELTDRKLTLSGAHALALQHLRDNAERVGLDAMETETVFEEEFNLVRGFYTSGKIITACVQLKPGILTEVSVGGEQ